jgi:hypothetical protein
MAALPKDEELAVVRKVLGIPALLATSAYFGIGVVDAPRGRAAVWHIAHDDTPGIGSCRAIRPVWCAPSPRKSDEGYSTRIVRAAYGQ